MYRAQPSPVCRHCIHAWQAGCCWTRHYHHRHDVCSFGLAPCRQTCTWTSPPPLPARLPGRIFLLCLLLSTSLFLPTTPSAALGGLGWCICCSYFLDMTNSAARGMPFQNIQHGPGLPLVVPSITLFLWRHGSAWPQIPPVTLPVRRHALLRRAVSPPPKRSTQFANVQFAPHDALQLPLPHFTFPHAHTATLTRAHPRPPPTTHTPTSHTRTCTHHFLCAFHCVVLWNAVCYCQTRTWPSSFVRDIFALGHLVVPCLRDLLLRAAPPTPW